MGRDKERLRNFEVTPDKFKRWEDGPRTVAEVKRYAQVLAKLPDTQARQSREAACDLHQVRRGQLLRAWTTCER